MNLLSRIIQVHLGDIAGSLGGSHLVGSVEPVPYRNMNHHAYVPDSGKLLLETIEYVRVRNHVTACQHDVRQIDGANHIGSFFRDVERILQHAEFRTGVHR